ncbi:hypothetical protein A9Q84_21480 [Halobacteriovorax marinus]|uniref:Peptidase metallopeptidase domain-containing protein n=1 Tax=Halobacteriovorax marinus TaxID=97084 RepID=A0A1Y5F1Q0_9BACT|nr:hypothetical protein A9Q84_21480 [Halobacteriovorax marinus]
MLKPFSFILLLLISLSAQAFVINRVSNGSYIKWQSGKVINLNLSTSNLDGLSSANVQSIVANSVSQWTSKIPNQVKLFTTNDGEFSSRNDIYFQNNSVFFSDPTIVASTTMLSDINTGQLYEADIILNDSQHTFSTSTISKKYLGNIITHEVGHLLGLGHSQILDASMFYELRKGQSLLHDDDNSGVRHLYGTSGLGTISGTVAGSAGLISIFGAHVIAFSLQKGEEVASSVSDSNGSFVINNLPLNETYFLYVEPLNNLSSLPSYYSVRKKNFCDSNNSYKGAFFQRCFGSDRGHPYGIKLSSSTVNINVGYVSIKCGLDVSGDYNLSKGSSNSINLVSQDISNHYIGSSSVGFFNSKNIAGTVVFDDAQDEYSLNLSQHNLSSIYPGKDLYLEVQIHTQPFFSPLRVKASLDNADYMTPILYPSTPSIPIDANGNYDLDIKIRIPMNLDQSKNVFSLKLFPESLDNLSYSPYVQDIFTVGKIHYNEGRHFYFMTTRLIEKVGIDYYQVSEKNYGSLSDNQNCMDASGTYKVVANTVTTESFLKKSSKKKDDALPLACGSITTTRGGPTGGGPGASLVLTGFFMILALRFKSSQILE